MFDMKSRKGLSNVVGTVVLVLLTITSVGLIWGYVGKLVDANAQLGPQFNCLDHKLDGPFGTISLDKACLKVETNQVEVLVRRALSELTVREMGFVIDTESGSLEYECGLNCGGCSILNPGEAQFYYFDVDSEMVVDSISVKIGGCGLGEIDIEICEN